jgi:cytochrome c oxidase assembly factor CtaG
MSQYLVMSRLLMIWMLLTTAFLIYWRMTQPPVQTPASRPSNRVVWLQR